VQQWRSWRAGVGSPGDDGARGWASWHAGVGRPSDDGAPGWSGGGGRRWTARGVGCGGGRHAVVGGGGRRAGWAVEEDGALGWAALGHKQMGLLRCQQIQVKNSTTLFTELCTHLFIRVSVSQRMCSLGWL
jgi:hypothetical protein